MGIGRCETNSILRRPTKPSAAVFALEVDCLAAPLQTPSSRLVARPINIDDSTFNKPSVTLSRRVWFKSVALGPKKITVYNHSKCSHTVFHLRR